VTEFLTLSGRKGTSVVVRVTSTGPWVADVDLEGDVALTGAVELRIGPLTLVGTVDPEFSGAFQKRSRCRVVAGANGWRTTVAELHYHNDAEINLSQVLGDAASLVGETLTVQAGADRSIGIDCARELGAAADLFDQLGASWWVGYDGVTVVGTRPVADAAAGVELLTFDPLERVATVAADDPRAVTVGTRLKSRLDTPMIVRELELTVQGAAVRFTCWCSDDDASALGRLERGLRALTRDTRRRYSNIYRYRVVDTIAGDGPGSGRLLLQAVRKGAGLPNMIAVSIWPGMAGLSAGHVPGSIVLVAFVEGDLTLPVVVHFSPKGEPGALPTSSTVDASDVVKVGPTTDEVVIGDNASRVEVAGGPDPLVLTGAQAVGRVVRYGDFLYLPSPLPSTPIPVIAAPNPGDPPGWPLGGPSKVSA